MKKTQLTQTIKIKDLGKVITGTTPPTVNQQYFGGKYLFIKPSDIMEDKRYIKEMVVHLPELTSHPSGFCCLLGVGMHAP